MINDINKTLKVLREGGTFLYPTDTIWGIGCDATNEEAVSKIFKLKQREDSKSLIVLIDDVSRLDRYVEDIPEVALQLMEYAEKPLTLVLEGAKYIANNALNQSDKTVGIRVAKDKFCQELIHRFRKPIISTSANISGYPSPSNFSEIDEELINGVDYVVEHRQDDFSTASPSSIIMVRKDSTIKIIRE